MPGEPSPTPVIWSQDNPLADTARRPASARLAMPTSGPRSASVSRLTDDSGCPTSSTTPLLMFVPPRSIPR